MDKARKIQIGLLAVFVISVLAVPLFASAQNFDAKCLGQGGCWGPLITCTGDYTGVTHGGTAPANTCRSVCDITVLIQTWIFFFYSIILYFLAPVGFAIGGFFLLTAGGNEERITKGRGISWKTFKWFIVATLIVALVGFIIKNLGISAGGTSTATTPLGMSIACNRTNNPLDVNLQNSNPNLNCTGVCGGECTGSCPEGKTCQSVPEGGYGCY